jgi:uncharacterized protein (DUF1501 family)
MFDRRSFLKTAGAGAFTILPGMSFASLRSDRRFVFIIQRGAADGLNIVIPYADPDYQRLRGTLAVDPVQAIMLDGSFALHPALPQTAAMFDRKEALFVHAIATPYRDRSHFDGQNILETGGTQPYRLTDGWLNRLIALLPKGERDAIAFANAIPAAVRGAMPITSYESSSLAEPSDDLLLRVGSLYREDPELLPLWSQALEAREKAGKDKDHQDPANLGRLAAKFLGRPEGPRIAMMETAGWDTHSGQAGRLAARLAALDGLLGGLRDGLGPVWARTTVLVATEFGRTAAANGTGGTDHGTASVAWLVGGAVRGGRIIADWPGLGSAALFQGRDLMPTNALDGLIAAVGGQVFGLDPIMVARNVFGAPAPAGSFDGLTV